MSELRIYVQRLRNASIKANEKKNNTFDNDSPKLTFESHLNATGNLYLLESTIFFVVFPFRNWFFLSLYFAWYFARSNNIAEMNNT